MEFAADDIAVHAFYPDDGSDSAAIKVQHRTSLIKVVNNDTDSQVENLRRALLGLVHSMNPSPDGIPQPKLMLFDPVRVILPESIHEGEITRVAWDFMRHEWKYFVECRNHVITTWYMFADLELIEDEDEDEEEEEEEEEED